MIPLPLSGGTAATIFRQHSAHELLATENLDPEVESDWSALTTSGGWPDALKRLVTRFGYMP